MSEFLRVVLRLLSVVVLANFVGTGCESDSRRAAPPQEQATPSLEESSGRASDVRSAVARFMQRRHAGRGAEQFLDSDGREAFAPGGSLAPLYPKPPIRDFRIAFVDGPLGGPHYEVGVELAFARGSYGGTLFVSFDGHRYVITGGRPGLEGP